MRATPENLKSAGRTPQPFNDPNEDLYRRVPPISFECGEDLDIDAIKLPDISVSRASCCESPADVLFDPEGRFDDWGAYAVPVGGVPSKMAFRGTYDYKIETVHCPTKSGNNYAHSEIRAHESRNGGPYVHVGTAMMKMIDPEFHLVFRQKLLEKLRVAIQPGEYEWRD
jgi:hypothetical protein